MSKEIKVQGDGTLGTDNGDAMTQEKLPDVLVAPHPVRRRRLRTIHGRQLLEVAQMAEHLCNAVRRAVERTNNFAGYAQVALSTSTDPQNDYSYSCSTSGSYATYNANTLDNWQKLIVEQKGWAGRGAPYYACAQGCAGTCRSTGHKGALAPRRLSPAGA